MQESLRMHGKTLRSVHAACRFARVRLQEDPEKNEPVH